MSISESLNLYQMDAAIQKAKQDRNFSRLEELRLMCFARLMECDSGLKLKESAF